jgi:hypothetical protein
MDTQDKDTVMMEIRHRLKDFRWRANNVAARPFEFLKICDELEDMAKTIEKVFSHYQDKKVSIRRRVYTPQGYLDSHMRLDDDGTPRMKNGKPLLKPNLEAWTANDAELDRRIAIARANGRAVW